MPFDSFCELSPDLQQRLRSAGLRRTRALQAVLALFERMPTWSPTHAQVAERLAAEGETVNAVTLYRLLDRLVGAGLLGRRTVAGERMWRFFWVAPSPSSAPLFECDACHCQFPLADADAPTQAVADALRQTLARHGHQAARLDLAVHGTCADCRTDRTA